MFTGGAVFALALVAFIIVANMEAPKPEPRTLTEAETLFSNATSADDWASLPQDDAGNPIGTPVIPLDKDGNVVIPAGQAEEKRGADEPLPVVLIEADATVLDTTIGTADLFGMLLTAENPNVQLERDQCLLDWATTTLPTLSGSASSGIAPVCGRVAAVMYGGYSTSVRDLNLHANYAPNKAERAGLSNVLFENDWLSYASVATSDGQGVLLVVAPATGDNSTKIKSGSAADSITRTVPESFPRPDVLPDP